MKSKNIMHLGCMVLAIGWLSTAQAEEAEGTEVGSRLILTCDSGHLTVALTATAGIYEARVSDPAAIQYFVERAQGKACGPSYYGGDACVDRVLPGTVKLTGEQMLLLELQKGREELNAGQYQPMLAMKDGGIELSISTGAMPNSHTFISYDLGKWFFPGCQQLVEFPRGKVKVTVLGDAVQNGALAGSPLGEVGVFQGEWQAGKLLGTTDERGELTLEAEEGALDLSVFKTTSSHSALYSQPQYVEVQGGETVALDIHVAPVQVSIQTSFDCGFGNALYVTGETDYLGSWTVAYKMTRINGQWVLQKNLPLGAAFKLVLAPWTDADTLMIQQIRKWERGANHLITPPQGSYESSIRVNPKF